VACAVDPADELTATGAGVVLTAAADALVAVAAEAVIRPLLSACVAGAVIWVDARLLHAASSSPDAASVMTANVRGRWVVIGEIMVGG